MQYPGEKNLNSRTEKAIQLFHDICKGSKIHNWASAFLSGFAVDAHFGYITKNHKDLDIIISKEQSLELSQYLTELGHVVYEAEKYKGECLKVDQADSDKETQAHGDIHYYWEEDGKVVIPLLGKKLVLNGSFVEITEQKEFLGETIMVLKPAYLLEEKKGWCEQVGLSQCVLKPDEYQADIDKILYLRKLQ